MNILEFSEVLVKPTFIVTATCNLSQEETLRHDLFLKYSMFKMYLLYRIFKTLDSEIEDKINIFEFGLLLQLVTITQLYYSCPAILITAGGGNV